MIFVDFLKILRYITQWRNIIMKKQYICLILALLVLGLFSCGWEFPNAVEIKWTPNITLAANFSIGERFLEDFDINSIFDNIDMEVFEATAVPIQTYLIYSEIFNETFDLSNMSGVDFPDEMPDDIRTFLQSLGIAIEDEEAEFIVDKKETVISGGETIPLSEMGELLDGFTIEGAEVIIFISGYGGLTDYLTFELSIGTYTREIPIQGSQPSDIAHWRANGYTSTEPPASAIRIPLSSMLGDDIDVTYIAFIEEGTVLTPETMSKDATLKLEFAIWFPLNIVAGPGGSYLDFSQFLGDLFDGEDEEGQPRDVFNRKGEPDDVDLQEFIRSMFLGIQFDNNPFSEGEIIITSPDFNTLGNEVYRQPLGGNSLDINIDELTLSKINNPVNIPLIPEIKIFFPEGEGVVIPRGFDFNITQFTLSARVEYRHEL
jgi:hypothetical protein